MSKAVLVMDMPESCMGCNFTHCDAESNTESCLAKETARLIDLEKYDKPDWCPLRPMPEKKDTICYENDAWHTVEEKTKNEGWNACIDALEVES